MSDYITIISSKFKTLLTRFYKVYAINMCEMLD